MPTFDPEKIACWSGGTWGGPAPKSITGVCHDTRTLRPGNLYVALRGEAHDGHDFVRDAFDRGVSAAMVERSYAVSIDRAASCSLLYVEDTLDGLQATAKAYRHSLSTEIMGVTGSVGKSTVKEMAANILSGRRPTACTPGNWNNHIGLPLSLLTMDEEDQYGVFEVGMNAPGEIASLCEILEPSWGIMTTVGPAHMAGFNSVEAVAEEKASLLRALPDDGVAVISRDEAWYTLFHKAAACRVVTVSMTGAGDYRGAMTAPQELRVIEEATGNEYLYKMPFSGDFIMRDALLAIAVGREHALSPARIQSGLRRFKPLPMRWNLMEVDGVRYVNDAYNANPVSMRAALSAFGQMAVAGNRWLVLAGMRELGRGEKAAHRELGRSLAGGAWAGLITVGSLGEWIAEGARKGGYPPEDIYICTDHDEAARVLRTSTQAGDAVLLKGSRAEALEKMLPQAK